MLVLVIWRNVDDPRDFACSVLGRESRDVNPDTLRRSEWAVETMRLSCITLAPGVVERQQADPGHAAHTDELAAAIAAGTPIPPLIVIGTEPVAQPDGTVRYLLRPYPEVGRVPMLADGYHRYVALTRLGIQHATVIRQQRNLSGSHGAGRPAAST
jgi:hypothetical protein